MSRIVQGSLIAAAVAVLATGCTFSLDGKSSNGKTTGAGGTTSPSAGSGGGGGNGGGTGGGGGNGGGGGGGGTGGSSGTRCTAAQLRATVIGLSPGAGQRYARLTLTNISGRACRVYGFPGLGLASPSNPSIPTSTRRTGSPAAFVVKPGGHAYSLLHWTAVPGDGEAGSECEPSPTALHVIPPDERSWVRASWTLGPVCQHGQIDLQPLSPAAPAQ
ncbi:DUF4232 domain-containing protein [Actinomadura rupiterrae]|uniref:DUF4232 domain-containing protein n=1 Tax=Actinomadura rupiterrae TaxID=559627 RepID=UPI0020A3EF2A|nr:DUF4232 domain-containing protein [Actinomadura rupiterrae]MCP2336791.1 hypothetical protein [Actinomadura rupiterrae]